MDVGLLLVVLIEVAVVRRSSRHSAVAWEVSAGKMAGGVERLVPARSGSVGSVEEVKRESCLFSGQALQLLSWLGKAGWGEVR